jgi:hypothetical protein
MQRVMLEATLAVSDPKSSWQTTPALHLLNCVSTELPKTHDQQEKVKES